MWYNYEEHYKYGGMNLNFKSNITLGKITFSISLLILVYMIGTTFYDVFYPLDNPNSKILIVDDEKDIS